MSSKKILRGLSRLFIEYYESLMATFEDNTCDASTRVVNEGPLINAEQHQALCEPFIGEILENKVAGPNAYSSGFFKKAWSYIGEEVIKVVLEFF